MSETVTEQRKYERYDTEVKIYFQVSFDLKTKVRFRIIDTIREKILPKKYSAVSRNVSAEGLCFVSGKELEKGDILSLEVYVPSQRNPIPMQGEVRWSQGVSLSSGRHHQFMTGVKLISVNAQAVAVTIVRDDVNKVVWSVVLESIFGTFKKFANECHKL